jgi:hypothetical protein
VSPDVLPTLIRVSDTPTERARVVVLSVTVAGIYRATSPMVYSNECAPD